MNGRGRVEAVTWCGGTDQRDRWQVAGAHRNTGWDQGRQGIGDERIMTILLNRV